MTTDDQRTNTAAELLTPARLAAIRTVAAGGSVIEFAPPLTLALLDELDAVRADLDTALATLTQVRELPDRWMARIPHQSGAFYPEAHAADDAKDIAYEACADDLRAALDGSNNT